MALWLAERPAPSSKAAGDLSRWCVAAMSTTTWPTAGRRRSMWRSWLAMPERSQTEHLSWHNRADGGLGSTIGNVLESGMRERAPPAKNEHRFPRDQVLA